MQEKQEPLPGLLYEANLPLHGSSLKEQQELSGSSESRLLGGYDSYYDSSFTEQESPLLPMKSTEATDQGGGILSEEQKSDDVTTAYNTSIKLGLGDFCFYSVLVGNSPH